MPNVERNRKLVEVALRELIESDRIAYVGRFKEQQKEILSEVGEHVSFYVKAGTDEADRLTLTLFSGVMKRTGGELVSNFPVQALIHQVTGDYTPQVLDDVVRIRTGYNELGDQPTFYDFQNANLQVPTDGSMEQRVTAFLGAAEGSFDIVRVKADYTERERDLGAKTVVVYENLGE